MKNTKPFLIIILLVSSLAFASCNFSKGTNKDLRSGLSYSYNGFRVEKVVMLNPSNEPMTDNKVQLNTKISIVATGVDNYGLKEGKAFPGMALVVTNKDGVAVIKEDDLFKNDQGHPPADAATLTGTITVGTPMASGQTYHAKIRIWDKVTPENELTAEVDLVVE